MDVVYEDSDVLVVHKPSGLIVHSDGKTQEPTVVDWLLEKYPNIEPVGESWTSPDGTVVLRPGIVHRLDRDTSGVLLITKTQEAFVYFKKQFQERTIEKTYLAFVYGVFKEKEGTIDKPIGKSAKDFRLKSAQPGAKGTLREAKTDYKVLRECGDVSYLELHPHTGRTHQIRVHLKAIHHPVVCDPLYAPNHECALGFKRMALHANSLTFDTLEGKRIQVESQLPEDFEAALELCGE